VSRNQPGLGGRTTVGRTGSGDVYAGHDGNVYRNTGDGWQKYEGSGDWGSVNTPQPTAGTRDRATTGSGQVSNRTGQAGTATGATNRVSPSDRATFDQLNRDARARSEGSRRTSDFSSARSGSYSGRSGSSYRPSGGYSRGGGMSRGGGGRRR
jgi:hypothetical protein